MEEITITCLRSDNISKEITQFFLPLLELDSHKLQIFLHGSWSDNSTTPFSDIDDFVIVDDDYYEIIKDNLEEVELNFQKKDPLQHHGHWLVKKSQLECYDNSYMPLFIMEEALCLFGSKQISAKINKQEMLTNTVKRIKNTCKNITHFYKEYKTGRLNLYDLKRFVGSVVLLPPLIFQLKGQEINKRQAILNSDRLFSDGVLNLIKWSSECRENWNIVIEDETYVNFLKNLEMFTDAVEWRKYASANAPVLNYKSLSSVQLNDLLINNFIEEALIHIDDYKFQRKEITEYVVAFEKIKNYSIANNALLVGQFGSVKYPSISDLDVFVCFKDEDYKQGCFKVDNLIREDASLSYLFTHSPFYVCESMLHDIKYIHTLYDLKIVYNPQKLHLDIQLDEEYQTFLDMVWSYLIFQTMTSITRDIKYYDMRTVLLSLKNGQTSLFNLEKLLGISSDELLINHSVRLQVLDTGIQSRSVIEEEYYRVFEKMKRVLEKVDQTITLSETKLNIFGITYVVAEKTCKKNNYVDNAVYINKVFFNLIFNIYKKRDSCSKKYLNTIRKNAKLHQKFGGYINTYIWIVPSKFVEYNVQQRALLKAKSVVRRIIKKMRRK